MKHILAILTVIVLISCQDPQPQRLEPMLMDCLMEQFKTEPDESQKRIAELEKALVEAGILRSADAAGYYELMQNATSNKLPTWPEEMPTTTNWETDFSMQRMGNCVDQVSKSQEVRPDMKTYQTFTREMKNFTYGTNSGLIPLAQGPFARLEQSDYEYLVYRIPAIMTIVSQYVQDTYVPE